MRPPRGRDDDRGSRRPRPAAPPVFPHVPGGRLAQAQHCASTRWKTSHGLDRPNLVGLDLLGRERTRGIKGQSPVEFDRAREAFARGDPKAALALVDAAIKDLPTDATLHEFRALCLFALKDYRRAAETLYAVLAAGPGWDWETMHALYPDVATYTEQLRTLEAYQRANPTSPEASFVLAYQYLVLGHLDAAIRQLENVVKLLPESQLASELLAALKAEANEHAPSPGEG